ncbi:MAG: TIGR04066 family peptide maturation system protein [Clostridiaceae bacterium]|jgi:peptide maturation system protein (TIGR04066 family)|nr:TIGR04066 family peptide maturation system protein [Clostridiaceae bacterium]
MQIKEKAVLYPYDNEFTPLINHQYLLAKHSIDKIISPRGWGMCGKDAGSAFGCTNFGLKICDNFEVACNECSTIIFSDFKKDTSFEELIFPKIEYSINTKKNIINTIGINEEIDKQIASLCERNNVLYINYRKCKHNNCINTIIDDQYINLERISKIRTPIILVLGISEKTNKFEIQLSLRENFIRKGYKVGQIGTRSYCELLGFHSMPQFIYDTNISESKKITLFNYYVKKMELIEKPDVIIIGVPGGVMPFNDILTNKFGITAYEISQAIIPDAVVFSTLYEKYLPSFYEDLSRSVKYKFGFDIDCFNLSNNQFDWESSKTKTTLVENITEFITYDSDYVTTNKCELSIPNYNILDNNDSNEMFEYIENKLSGYGEVNYF